MAEPISIDAFLGANVQQVEEKHVHFARFPKADFIIRPVTETEVNAIRKQATVRGKQNGIVTGTVDSARFADLLVAAAVVQPDLNNSKLQQAMGTPGKPSETLQKLLLAGEYAKLGEEVQKLAGFDADEDLDELSDEVKN